MPTNEIQRPNFYPGQYLSAADLIAAQEYQHQQDRRHRLAAHTWGIAVGLELEERPKPGGGDAVDVYLKPGYAVDGFGRAIVVLEPHKILEALFTQFPLDPATPKQIIPVWLLYREEKANPPRPGLANCDAEEQWYRIRETFRIVVGAQSLAQQRDKISVARKLVDAAALFSDASVPYQTLREAGDDPRWLVPLGKVSWSGSQFVQSVDPKTSGDGRQYVGVVAESVLAPAGLLRIADRFSDPLPSDPTNPRFGGVAVTLEGSLEVRRLLTAKQDVYVEGRVGIGTENPAGRLTINGMVQPGQGAITVFSQDADFLYDGGDDKLFIFKDTGGKTAFMGGNVGIGSTSPVSKLQIGGDLALEAIPTGAPRPLPPNGTMLWNDGTWLRLNQNLDFSKPIFGVHTPGVFASGSLNVGGVANWGDPGFGNAWISGKVGIGTSTPKSPLEVVGDLNVTGGNVWVDGRKIPVSVPVSVQVEVLSGLKRGPFQTNTDEFKRKSTLGSVTGVYVMVALSEFNIDPSVVLLVPGNIPSWKVQYTGSTVDDPSDPKTYTFHVLLHVPGSAKILAYSWMVIFTGTP